MIGEYCKVYQLFAQGLEFYWWIQDTRVSSIVCFTILVLPVLLDEEYWSFQYHVFYNTSITSIEAAGRDTGIITHYNIYNTRNTSIVMLHY
jgi:hypothetical protein